MNTTPRLDQSIMIQQVPDPAATASKTTPTPTSTTTSKPTSGYTGTFEVLDGTAVDPKTGKPKTEEKGKIKITITLEDGSKIERVLKVKVKGEIVTNLEEVEKIVRVFNETLVFKSVMDAYVQAAKDHPTFNKGTSNTNPPRLRIHIGSKGVTIESLDSTKNPSIPKITINENKRQAWQSALHNSSVEKECYKNFKKAFADCTQGKIADALNKKLVQAANKKGDPLNHVQNEGVKRALEQLQKEAQKERGTVTFDKLRSDIPEKRLNDFIQQWYSDIEMEEEGAELITDGSNRDTHRRKPKVHWKRQRLNAVVCLRKKKENRMNRIGRMVTIEIVRCGQTINRFFYHTNPPCPVKFVSCWEMLRSLTAVIKNKNLRLEQLENCYE